MMFSQQFLINSENNAIHSSDNFDTSISNNYPFPNLLMKKLLAIVGTTFILASFFNNNLCVRGEGSLVPNPAKRFATVTDSPSNVEAALQAQSAFCHAVAVTQ